MMQNPTVSQPNAVRTASSKETTTSLRASLALVVGFWWAATGVTLALHRSAALSQAGIVIASLLAVAGAQLVLQSRTETSVRAARLAFLGSSLLWLWCSTLFYAGIGIRLDTNVASGARTWSLAMQAIDATLRADLIGVAVLLGVAVVVWRQPNRVALWTLAIFWGTLQTAKLNVFMGVRNSGADWLPEHLQHLSQYFGPPHNSWLLPVTVMLLTSFLVASTRNAQQSASAFRKHAHAMSALLLALAVFEHVFLGLNFTLPLWDIFRALP